MAAEFDPLFAENCANLPQKLFRKIQLNMPVKPNEREKFTTKNCKFFMIRTL